MLLTRDPVKGWSGKGPEMLTFSAEIARTRIDDHLRGAEAARTVRAARAARAGAAAPVPASAPADRRLVIPECAPAVLEQAGAR